MITITFTNQDEIDMFAATLEAKAAECQSHIKIITAMRESLTAGMSIADQLLDMIPGHQSYALSESERLGDTINDLLQIEIICDDLLDDIKAFERTGLAPEHARLSITLESLDAVFGELEGWTEL